MEAIVNGAGIHYQRSGKGFPLLLIHAGASAGVRERAGLVGLLDHL